MNFKINSLSSIKIKSLTSLQELTPCDDVEIVFEHANSHYIVYSNDTIIWALRCLNSSLNAALKKELKIPDFFENRDIGYIWNEDLNAVANHSKENLQQNGEWQDNYLVWNHRGFALWIYNKNESIFFEITPVYKWFFSAPNSDEQYVSYEEFIKHYQPCSIIEIDQETAQNILKQSDDLLRMLAKSF